MKRTVVLVSVMFVLLALAVPARGQQRGPDWPTQGPPPHGHMLVLDVQFAGGQPVGFGRCIDLGANQVLPRNAHHEHLHVGDAGAAQLAAGNMIVPTVLSGFADCAALEAAFG